MLRKTAARCIVLNRFFEDFSGSCGQILLVARFKIISDQGGSVTNDPVFRKICFRVQLGPRSFGYAPENSKIRSLVRYFCFWAALPGAQPWKGLRPHEEKLHMACRDDKQCFIGLTLGQIERQKLTNFSYARCALSLIHI